MKTYNTVINLKEVRSFYSEYCREKGKKFTKKEFLSFLDCCERDFFQWLKDNLKYFESGVVKPS